MRLQDFGLKVEWLDAVDRHDRERAVLPTIIVLSGGTSDYTIYKMAFGWWRWAVEFTVFHWHVIDNLTRKPK